MQLWILAVEHDGYIPIDEEEIKFKLRLPGFKLDELNCLVDRQFLIHTNGKESFESPWPSRYIKPEYKKEAMERAGSKCGFCGSKKNLEYDHIVPVSQGGKSIPENIQVLCRSCNRKKRAYVASATQKKNYVASDVPETETETETETEGEETKNSYGQFSNVLLTGNEYEKLIERFGENLAADRIEGFSEALKSKGLKYKDHYATILNWARRDGINGKRTSGITDAGDFLKFVDEKAADR